MSQSEWHCFGRIRARLLAVMGQLIPDDPSLVGGAVECDSLALEWSQISTRPATSTADITLKIKAIQQSTSVSDTRQAKPNQASQPIIDKERPYEDEPRRQRQHSHASNGPCRNQSPHCPSRVVMSSPSNWSHDLDSLNSHSQARLIQISHRRASSHPCPRYHMSLAAASLVIIYYLRNDIHYVRSKLDRDLALLFCLNRPCRSGPSVQYQISIHKHDSYSFGRGGGKALAIRGSSLVNCSMYFPLNQAQCAEDSVGLD